MNDDFAMKLLGDEDDDYSKYDQNITEDDLRETIYVLSRPDTRLLDMELYCGEEDCDDEVLDNITLTNLAPNQY